MLELKSQEVMEQIVISNLKQLSESKKIRVENMMKVQFVNICCEKKTLTLSFPVLDWELNPLGIMHGGLITTAFDNTYGMFIHCLAEKKYITTVNIATSFLKPVNLNDNLVVTVTANSIGRSIINMTAEAYLKSNGVLAATSSATFMILEREFNFFNE